MEAICTKALNIVTHFCASTDVLCQFFLLSRNKRKHQFLEWHPEKGGRMRKREKRKMVEAFRGLASE